MTVEELISELEKVKDKNRYVVIANVRNSPFATHSIKEVVDDLSVGISPIYLNALRNK